MVEKAGKEKPGILERPLFNGSEPWWVRVIERLGLPTFLLLVLLFAGWKVYERAEASVTKTTAEIVTELKGLGTAQQEHNDQLDELIDEFKEHR